jgi:hypothetical protein
MAHFFQGPERLEGILTLLTIVEVLLDVEIQVLYFSSALCVHIPSDMRF